MADFDETPQQQGQPNYQSSFPQSNFSQGNFNYQNQNGEVPPLPNNYMVLAIVTTILGLCSCIGLVLGIIAIVFASQVNSKYTMGDYIGAEQSSKNAKLLSIIGLVVNGISIIISIIYYVIIGAAAFSNYGAY